MNKTVPDDVLPKELEGPELVSIPASTRVDDDSVDSEPDQASGRHWSQIGWSVWLAGAIVLALFTNWIVPRISVAIDMIGNFQLQLVLLAIGIAIVQLFRRRWIYGTVILLLIAWPAMTFLNFFFPTVQPEAVTRSIRLLTYNVHNKNGAYEETIEMIRDVNPDIIGLVEFDNNWADALEGKLQDYPHRVGPFFGNIIYSKIPLDRKFKRSNTVAPRLLPGIFATFRVDDQRVYFLLVHAISPKTPSRLMERDSQISGIRTSMFYQTTARHVVLAGDFNSTSHSYALETMVNSSGLRDSRKGFGLQHSWPTWFWPMSVCIDHCFVSEGVCVEDRYRGPNAGSDHLPVVVDLSFANHKRSRPRSTAE